MTRRKITNVSGEDLIVPWLNGRLVAAGEVVLVAEEDVPAYLCQPMVWEAGDAETLAAYEDVVAAATLVLEQAAAQHAELHPEPWVPDPVPLGADAAVDNAPPQATGASRGGSEVQAPPLEEQPPPPAQPAPESPTLAEPAPATQTDEQVDPEPEAAPGQRLSPRLQQLLDRTHAPAASTFTGSLPAQPRL